MLSRSDNETIARTARGTPTGEFFRRFWLPALLPDELPAPDYPPIRLKLLNEDLVAFRDTNGEVGIFAANCPHRGASLFFGRNEESGLRCVYHGWKFDVSGACVDMPSEPAESNFKAKVRANAYPTRQWAGVVWVYMGPSHLTPELPEFEWAQVPESHRYIGKYVVEANWLQVIEGSIDTVHTGFLHRGPSTREHQAELAARSVDGRGRRRQSMTDFSDINPPQFSTKETDYGVMVMARRRVPDNRSYWRITQVFLPSYSMIPANPDGGASLVGTVPIDDHTCFSWKFTWNPNQAWTAQQIADMRGGSKRRAGGITYAELIPGTLRTVANARNDYLVDRELQRTLNFTGIPGQSEQDLAVQESMGAICDRTREHLGTTDLGIIQTRRRMLKAVRDLAQGTEPPAAGNGSLYRVRSAAITIPDDASLDDDLTVKQALLVKA